MQRNRSILTVVGLAVLGMAVLPSFAQTRKPAPKKPPTSSTKPSPVHAAEAAIDKQDYATALPLLEKAVADNPKDDQAWYYLGYVNSATGNSQKSADAYRHAVEANPKFFEATLNLGLSLAASGDHADAEKFLKTATTLKPESNPNESLFRAWFALGRLLADTNPTEAIAAFGQATHLQPKQAAPHLDLGQLLEKQNDFPAAEKEFQQVLTLAPNSSEAIAGLANVYMRTNRFTDAESMLRKLSAAEPRNVTAHLQLGRVLRAQKKNDEAVTEFAAAQQLAPNDPGVLREVAGQQLAAKKYSDAEASFRALLAHSPQDPELHFALANALLYQHKNPEAQAEYLKAVQLKPEWGEAYSELAVAANGNQDYPLVLRALAARAKFLPETAGTYFLRATAFDHLKDAKQASDNYKQFLALANGQFPDQEWQARHRLLAIDPETRKDRKK